MKVLALFYGRLLVLEYIFQYQYLYSYSKFFAVLVLDSIIAGKREKSALSSDETVKSALPRHRNFDQQLARAIERKGCSKLMLY